MQFIRVRMRIRMHRWYSKLWSKLNFLVIFRCQIRIVVQGVWFLCRNSLRFFPVYGHVKMQTYSVLFDNVIFKNDLMCPNLILRIQFEFIIQKQLAQSQILSAVFTIFVLVRWSIPIIFFFKFCNFKVVHFIKLFYSDYNTSFDIFLTL